MEGLQALPLEEPAEQADSGSSHLRERLADRGQRRRHDRRVLDVVEADDREILGDAQPAGPCGLNGADRGVVVEREDRRRRVGQRQQRGGGISPGVDLGNRFDLERGVGEDAG